MNAHAVISAAEVERLEIVDTSDRLAAVEAPWTRLWQAADGLIFQSHGWISAWWNTLRDWEGTALRIGLAWHGDRLVAAIPLAISRRKGLRFLEWAAAAHSDYGDILCAAECTDAALGRLWAKLVAAGGFDLAFINRLLPDAVARRLFNPGTAGSIKLLPNHRQEMSSRISGGWESGAAWLASHPKKPRQNYKRSNKLLEESGTVRFRLLGPDEPRAPVLERLALLKRKWLERTEREAELFDEGAPALPALVEVMARAGVLRLFVLEVNGLPVALTVNFAQRGTMMAWVTTYDPDFSRASPGTVLIFDYVQWAFDHGLHTVDMLCGSEAFKERFATHTVALESLMGARTVKGSLALLADGVRQRLRQKSEAKGAPADPD